MESRPALLPQKIVLIRGIHPNELDLSYEIARELRKSGHRVKIVSIPYRHTLHWHLEHGEKVKDISEFDGVKFVNKIGFQHPDWHVIGIHSSPSTRITGVQAQSEGEIRKIGKTALKFDAGHFYLNFGGSEELTPAVPTNSGFVPAMRVRMAIEIPAVYQRRKIPNLDWNKISSNGQKLDQDLLSHAQSGYAKRSDLRKTFKEKSKHELVCDSADFIRRVVENFHKEEERYKSRGFEPNSYAQAVKNSNFLSPRLKRVPGYKRALQYAKAKLGINKKRRPQSR
jgi:hypothetical protein